MSSEFRDCLRLYSLGELGRSVRDVRLSRKSLRAVHKSLLAYGFVLHPGALAAERNADGQAQWYCIDCSSTTNRSDPKLAPIDCYVHADGGMVRVFPAGDPRGRTGPSGEPFAIKSVLFSSPKPAQEGTLEPHTSFRNEAFRVTDAGAAVPKSCRTTYGLRAHPVRALESYRFAREVMDHTVIPLLVGAA